MKEKQEQISVPKKICIPTKPYVKAFVENEIGIHLNYTDAFGNKIIHLVRKKSAIAYDPTKHAHSVHYTVELEIYICSKYERYFGNCLSMAAVKAFNTFAENYIKMIIYSQIELYLEILPSTKLDKAINYIREKYKFDEDTWPYESLYRGYHRFLKYKNTK